MYVPEKLKLNRFKLVAIPKKMEYFQRFGANAAPLPTSGDEVAPHQERKIEQVRATAEDLEAWDKAKQAEESQAKK